MKMIKTVSSFCQKLEGEFDRIPFQRKQDLALLADYFQKKFAVGETPRAVVICTHNSRRSHFGQIWLAVAADYFGLPSVETFSGGTEATAFNQRAVASLRRIGFEITSENDETANPTYLLKWKSDMTPYAAFSKKYDDPENPSKAFAAIPVCSEADAGCPVIFGADFRLALPYDDPKAFDGTDIEAEKYDERAAQIGREMLYCMSLVKTDDTDDGGRTLH